MTLSVNQESRAETLRYFNVHWIPNGPPRNPPIIIHSEDTLEIIGKQFVWMGQKLRLLLELLNGDPAGGLGKVKTIKLQRLPYIGVWDEGNEQSLMAVVARCLTGLTLLEVSLTVHTEQEIQETETALRQIFVHSPKLKIAIHDARGHNYYTAVQEDIDFMKVRREWRLERRRLRRARRLQVSERLSDEEETRRRTVKVFR